MSNISHEYLLKVILTGSVNSGKSTFLNGGISADLESSPLGVNLRKIECLVNNSDYLKLIIWELKASEPHLSLHPSYCRGASAAILTFSYADKDSFDKLSWWIDLLREKKTEIPLVLLGMKSDLKHEVSTDEIQILMEQYHIADFFEVGKEEDLREEVFKSLIKRMHLFGEIQDFLLVAPTYDKYFKNFLRRFGVCPICKAKNHENYLKRFYFSLKPEFRNIKEQFLDALSAQGDRPSKLRLEFGIPCCECYSRLFNDIN